MTALKQTHAAAGWHAGTVAARVSLSDMKDISMHITPGTPPEVPATPNPQPEIYPPDAPSPEIPEPPPEPGTLPDPHIPEIPVEPEIPEIPPIEPE